MNILSLECSSSHASIALHAPCPAEHSWTAERNHDAFLFPALQDCLRSLGEGGELPLILVGTGPGSYGGIRVALAAAVGVALVRHSRVVAIPSWEPLAAATGCQVLSDARRGGWALYAAGASIEVFNSADPIRHRIEQGEDIRSGESNSSLARVGIILQHTDLVPTARQLIDFWLSLSPEKRDEFAAKPTGPLYVRPPHITEAKRKPWEF